MDNIESMNSQCDYLRYYIDNSLLMQLDPMNVSVSEVNFIIETDGEVSDGISDALIDSYANSVRSGNYISVIADEYGYAAGSLQELINIDGDIESKPNASILLVTDNSSVRVLTIRVWGTTAELSEELLDGAVEELYNNYSALETSIAKHSITEIGRTSYTSFVLDVRDLQLKTMTTYQTLQSQIDFGNKYLDDIAKQLGLTDRNSLYADTAKVNTNNGSTTGFIKYAVVGFVLGVLFASAVCFCQYVFGSTIETQTQFFALFPQCHNIGVLKPSGKRSGLRAFIDRLSDDDTELSNDKSNAIISANYSNLTKKFDRVLITGTVDDKDATKSVLKEMGIDGDIQFDLFTHPELLRSLSRYDCVVIVEKRSVSKKKMVKKELELLKNGAQKILGAIIF